MAAGRETSSLETPDAVQSEIARLLTTPLLPDEYLGSDSVYDSNQLRQVRNFRGFITKVMHNGIRKYIPKTMALLSSLEIELDFYVAVSADYQRLRAQGPIPRDQHLKWYETALHGWVGEQNVQGAELVRDILAHELVLYHASQSLDKIDDISDRQSDVWIEGEVVLRRYSHDIPKTLRDMSNGELIPASVVLDNPMNLGYWLTREGAQSVMEIDDLTAHALSLVDGRRSVKDISKRFAEQGFPEVDIKLLDDIFTRLIADTPLQLVR